MKKIILFLLITLFSLHIFPQEKDYYVSIESGSDENDGLTLTTPFKTIKKAINSFDAAGGTCYILEGIYHEEIDQPRKKNIFITNYNNKRVVINGTKKISSKPNNWKLSPGRDNIYETQLNNNIWQLFINNEQQVMARWPNAQFKDQSVFNQSLWAKGDSNSSNGTMIVNSNNNAPNLSSIKASLTGAMMIGNIGSWTTYARKVTSHNPNSGNFTYNRAPIFRNGHLSFYLECDLDLLDTENEWFFDKETQKLYVYGNPVGKDIRGKVQTYAFTFEDSSNITFKGLSFFATTVNLNNSNTSTIENCIFSFPSCSKRMLKNEDAPLATSLRTRQPSFRGDFIIKNSLFEHIDGEALFIKGTHNTIENCYFQYIDYSCGSTRYNQNTIVSEGGDFTLKNTTIHTTGASSTVNVRAGTFFDFSYNDISNTGLLQNDGAIFQIFRGNAKGSRIHHNWLHDSRKTAIRYDAPIRQSAIGGTHGIIDHNVIWNCTKGINLKGDFHHVYNNTAFNNGAIDISILNEEMTDPNNANNKLLSNDNTTTRNNLAGKISGHRARPVDTGGFNIIPGVNGNNVFSETSIPFNVTNLLTDTNGKDFSPKANSVEIINTGIVDNTTINDPEINSNTPITNDAIDLPDIGAYELNGVKWTAGTNGWTPDFFPWNGFTFSEEDNTDPINLERILEIYPNPSSDYLIINSNVLKVNKITVHNVLGQFIETTEINTNEYRYDMEKIASGVYFFEIILENGDKTTNKIIKN